MTTRELQRYVRSVMRRLGMVEWIGRADIRMVRDLKDKDGEELDGISWWHAEERTCSVWVRRNADLRALKETAVHECLHILLEGHKESAPPEEYDRSYELALNRAASALVSAWDPTP